jgi:hypothetical protein
MDGVQSSVELRFDRRDAARGNDSINRHRIGKRKFGGYVIYFQNTRPLYSVTKKSRSSKTVKKKLFERLEGRELRSTLAARAAKIFG